GSAAPLHLHSFPTRRSSDLAPSADEQARDYLWRVHRQVPADGEIAIFNRSHYEDVLVPRARGRQDRDEQRRRLAQIADFERMLRSEEHTSELQSREKLVCRP